MQTTQDYDALLSKWSELEDENFRLKSVNAELLAALKAMLAAYDVPRECCNEARRAIKNATTENPA